ncbi:DUF2252 family protein [Modestobacter sp. VKM Ac-2983]|uniref:DUF2252 family protein n=1 Tax=Modestobacter sp. VKM Ac-2983 TaxID=3004137 RepID=UPI0022AB50CA|nr:DUF2252 family protein [Modestobacter sp. VKM Ac-2983]MCZ2805572.1 DUF2252 family protein [Modestobacter sp. VKM Ac-2983]
MHSGHRLPRDRGRPGPHLGNVGFYASPERDLVIDLNDFDEAHPGGWEWDLRRLAASVWVAGRQTSATEEQCEDAVASMARRYREHVRRLAGEPLLPQHPAGQSRARTRPDRRRTSTWCGRRRRRPPTGPAPAADGWTRPPLGPGQRSTPHAAGSVASAGSEGSSSLAPAEAKSYRPLWL